jgi:glutamate---cysteine ligase / carboxylate-amine ligase
MAEIWSSWNRESGARPWTVGLEEEVLLMDGHAWAPANRADDVLAAMPPAMAPHASPETHACVLELKTDPHPTVPELASELGTLRRSFDRLLRDEFDLRAAVAGTHPLATGSEVEISRRPRYRKIEALTQAAARREPTMALHVHVAVPNPASGVRALDGLRVDLPLLLALSANSPFWRGNDSGFASTRVPMLAMFPRFGIPRQFDTYANYVRVVEAMLRSGAVPEPGFIWWEVRLQPRLATVEVRIMDAQTRVADAAALAALVQCLVRRHAESRRTSTLEPEILAENRFLAARDGVRAHLIDAHTGRPRPARALLAELLEDCRPQAAKLGCTSELARAERLAGDPGDARQRRLATREGLAALPALLAADFAAAARAVVAA